MAKLLTPIGGTQARNGACAQPPCLLLQCAWNRLPLGGEEAGATAALRRILVEEKGHDRHAIRSAAYWKQGAVAHDENLED